jgi:argininosuccinate lyase
MKLWDKGKITDKKILEFTIGRDRELDMEFAVYDVIASIAHAFMLENVRLLTSEERRDIIIELIKIYDDIISEKLIIESDSEDIHSQIEKVLTEKLGETGKKIHTARSRNDQVLVDLKLFYRHKTTLLAEEIRELVGVLISKGRENADHLIPGYTHLQAAMPSSFGLWFGAYAESLVEDLIFHEGIMDYINLNPLGSAAGYGSSFPIDREMTTALLEFENLHVNSVNAQMSRGKVEKFIAAGLGSIAASLSRMSMDLSLFMGINFGFVSLKHELTTGSSIMPHKNNPDVIEIIRAKCNRISSLYNDILLLSHNLPSGYHRDFQLLKELLFPAYHEITDCIRMMAHVIQNLEIHQGITDDEMYRFIFSVENINEKVQDGIPFREAYIQVAKEIESGDFQKVKKISYTHTGSIGNPGFERIEEKFKLVYRRMDIQKYSSFEERFISKIRGS